MDSITIEMVEQMAEEMAKIFKQHVPEMTEAFDRLLGDLVVSMSCKWRMTQKGLVADVGIRFKVDEVNEKTSYLLRNGEQMALPGI